MVLDDLFKRGVNIKPSVFDRDFALPDTPFVAFQFADEKSMLKMKRAFCKRYPEEMLSEGSSGKTLIACRREGSDVPRLFADFIREYAGKHRTLKKTDVEVSGWNGISG